MIFTKQNDKVVKSLTITSNISIKTALKKIDQSGWAILFVCNQNGQLTGSLTDGDLRRQILKTGNLHETIDSCFNHEPVVVSEGEYTRESIKKLMLAKTVEVIPVIDSQKKMTGVLCWKDVFKEDYAVYKNIDIPVVIMAGGKGKRLDPFTRILPKALIPIGEKAIIEVIIDKFAAYNVKKFYVSVNHKSKMVKAYFEDIEPEYSVSYIDENIPLGTAGSLRFMHDKIKQDSLIVSNCDIIVDCNYSEMVDFHRENNYDISIVGSFRHYTIPYGVCEMENGGTLRGIVEKPEYDFLVNTGMYVIKKDVLNLIPKNQLFHITDLVKIVMAKGGNVGVFPVSEKSWIDVGQWEEYKKTIKIMGINI